jgi:hypothetical protein
MNLPRRACDDLPAILRLRLVRPDFSAEIRRVKGNSSCSRQSGATSELVPNRHARKYLLKTSRVRCQADFAADSS